MKAIKSSILTIFSITLCFIFSQNLFAKDVEYISPNTDGSKDELVIPLKIEEARYISEWRLEIFDEAGLKANPQKPIKVIGNKDKRDESASSFFRGLASGGTAKSFFKNVGKAFGPKKGVAVPGEIRWNGTLENGEQAKDGTYFYHLIAKDDNGNEARTKEYTVIIDTSVPNIDLTQPKEDAKIFGAGLKPVITFKQTGTKEDLWVGTITNSKGEVVKTYKWENSEPKTVDWDGQNDDGFFVDEGIYSYSVSCTNRAGTKSNPATVTNIIYDAIPRTVSMFIDGTPFSPGTKSEKKTLSVDLDVPNASGMTGWVVEVTPSSGKSSRSSPVWTMKGDSKSKVPSRLQYDGKGNDKKIIADGEYEISFTAFFNNGQQPSKTLKFEVDTVPPQVAVKCESNILAPGIDDAKNTIKFSQTAKKSAQWEAKIIDKATGKTVKNWEFTGLPPENLEWDGIQDDGNIAKDGKYYYEISAIDRAGNKTSSKIEGDFSIDTSKTEAILYSEYKAFSPNGDSVKDKIAFVPVIKTTSGVDYYYFSIKRTGGDVVYDETNKGKVKSVFEWDGKHMDGQRCTEGNFVAELTVVSNNGTKTVARAPEFQLIEKVPEVKKFEGDNLIFSPNGTSSKQTLSFDISTSSEDFWKLTIKNKKGEVVRENLWQNSSAGKYVWDGTDSQGNLVADGKYTAELFSENIGGNRALVKIEDITVDTRSVKGFITAENEYFSPVALGNLSAQKFSVVANPEDGIESWKISVLNENGKAVKEWIPTEDQKNLPKEIIWNGSIDEKTLADGSYIAKLEINYAKGDSVSSVSANFVCGANPPNAKVQTAPKYFSPDNDGYDDELFIKLKYDSNIPLAKWDFVIKDPAGSVFWEKNGKNSLTERLVWDGKSKTGELVQSATDYPYEFTVTDATGLETKVSGIIPVDVLVIRVGDTLKIQIPSIIFRANKADFVGKDKDPNKGLEKEQIQNNERVLRRIAEILNKFKDYNVIVEGHANNVSGTEEEEVNELIPLSTARAEFVKTRISRYGVNPARLSSVGKGGREPVAPTNDNKVNWKNRRVEFILKK